MHLTAEIISAQTGCAVGNVLSNWPLVVDSLEASGINSDRVQVAAAATIAVETGDFDFTKRERMANPEKNPKLAAQQARYGRYYGRGPAQLTWIDNYRLAGIATDLNLVADPDLALIPENGAKILAWFFKQNHVDDAAEMENWWMVRRLVNGINRQTGQPNGIEKFMNCVHALIEAS